ncbi:hypothetical protein AGOR_G00250520 [Albula goreensis]|uniref:Ciliary neurotrophic factor n=1 Tax=Albula goreensis TaxID=1534307 RepID=A0A8T3CEG0_9TELE|nr:hypothetical protein AGOR_G00250520 [Albula goreensis]
MAVQLEWRSPALALLSVVMVLTSVLPLMAEGCRTGAECSCILHRSTRLSRLMTKQAEDLLTTYIASQGDFSDLFCKLPVNDIPRAEISGRGSLERLRNVHATLGQFQQHIAMVTEEQRNLQAPGSPLLAGLEGAQAQVTNLAASVAALLQILHPNIPTEADGSRPYDPALAAARNVFQQKIYGCAVLSRHRDFLSNVQQELKDLKVKVQECGSRTVRSLRGIDPRRVRRGVVTSGH